MCNKKILTLLMCSLLLVSCVVVNEKFEMGMVVNRENVNKIIKGVSDKSFVFELFGPPDAVARKGKVIYIPAKEGAASRKVNSDTLFELFTADNKITEKHIIYYYDNTKVVGSMTFIMFAASGETAVHSNLLWILLNSETGVVQDFVYRGSD
ncbi:MAG: hypothetical protein KAQ67_07305 [Gammaproteobacteria bacterium]|nr:hypothetical protein [Gammaproteobacteria bacterium]